MSSFDDYSVKFHQVVSEDNKDATYKNTCEQMQRSLYQSSFINIERCQNILKYVNPLSNQKSDEEKNKLCAYLNYLLNCDASSNLIPLDYKSNFIDAYLRLLPNYKNVCYLSIEPIEEHVFQKLKDIQNMYKLLKDVK